MSFVAAIVTHRRPAELRRLLEGLAVSEVSSIGCVISDHAPDGSTEALARETSFPTKVLNDPTNPGPGAGWANAARRGLELFPDADSVLFLDDDVVIEKTVLKILGEDLEKAGAGAIAPLLADARGRLWAFPEPAQADLQVKIRQAATPEDARRLLGEDPVPFCWCTGACMLVTKALIARAGWHRSDFWILGEDLEYSMRLAGTGKAVFSCRAVVPHLPPDHTTAAAARRSDYVKFCALLQNLSYLAFHSPHSRHMKSYLPGNFRRLLRTHGWRPRVLRDAAQCFLGGALAGKPAGTESGQNLRRRIASYDF